jgi:hypothetical protein
MHEQIRFCYFYFLTRAEPGQVNKKIKGPAHWLLFARVVIRGK